MADDQIIVRIGADSAGVVAGMNEAGNAVATNAEKMAVSLKASGLSATEAQSALKNLGFTAEEVAVGMNVFGTQAEVATAKVTMMDRAMASGAVRMAAYEGGLGPIGMALSRVGAASESSAPLLAAAFPIIGAVLAIQVIGTLLGKLEELIQKGELEREAWIKIDHEAQVAISSEEKAIGSLEVQITELTEGKLAALDLKLRLVGDDAVEMASKVEGMLAAAGKEIDDSSWEKWENRFKAIGELSTGGGAGGFIAALSAPTEGELAKGFGASLTKTLDTQGTAAGLKMVDDQLNALYARIKSTPDDEGLKHFRDELEHVQSLLGAALTKESAEKQKDSLEIAKTAQEEQSKAAEAAIRDAKEQEELTARIARADLEESKQAQEAEKKKEEQVAALANSKIEAAVRVSDAQAEADEQAAKRSLEARKITISQETDLLRAAAQEKFGGQIQGKQDQITTAQAEPAVDNTAKIETLNGEIAALRIKLQSTLDSIDADGAKRQTEETMRQFDQRATAEAQMANKSLESANRIDDEKLTHHQESLAKWENDELTTLNKWYADQLTILNQAQQFALAHYGQDSAQYQQLTEKKIQLDQQYQEKNQQITQQVSDRQQQLITQWTSQFNTAFASWISGQQRAGLAFARMFDSILDDLVMTLVKMGEQWAIHWALVNILHIGAKAQQAATDAAGNAAQLAQTVATNTAVVTSEAGVAGAAGFASAMVAVPFPANLVAAPAAMAAAITATLSNLSLAAFEHGGISEGGLSILHPKEMVLDRQISEPLAAAAKSGNLGAGHTINVNMGSISAVDGRGLDKVLRSRTTEMVKHIDRAVRYGAVR